MIRRAWRSTYVVPGALALLLAVVALDEVVAGHWPLATPASAAWALATVVPVVFLRARPVTAWLAFAGPSTLLLVAFGEPRSAALFFTTIALAFGVGAFTDDRRQLIALAPTLLLLVGAVTYYDQDNSRWSERVTNYALTTLLLLLAAGAGVLVRRRSLAVGVARGDAELAARQARLRAELAVADERARIARDLHDVVAHGVSLMVVQAVGARGMLSRRPDSAVEAFDALGVAGTRTLEELDRLLGVLGEHPGHDQEGRRGLAAVEELVAAARRSGVEVTCAIDGPADTLPSGVDVAAYRILQECLTNVVKHSRARVVALAVVVTSAAVTLEVENPVTADRVTGGSGFGLVGIRERAAMYGGSVQAGIVDGVWSTRATLRLEP